MYVRCGLYHQGVHNIVAENCQELRIIGKCFIEELGLHWILVIDFWGNTERIGESRIQKYNKQRHANMEEQNSFRE